MRADTPIILMRMGFDSLKDFTATEDGVGGVNIAWHAAVPRPTQAEIDAAAPVLQAAADAEAADLAAYEADKQTLKTAIAAAATRLTQIKDAGSMTNAQVFNAVKDIANFQLQTIKALRRML